MPVGEIAALKQYLTFALNDEIFALDIERVKEVINFTKITKIPKTPDYMLGVIHLRGNLVPVVDLRVKLGVPAGEFTSDTCIIIAESGFEGETIMLGALVDSLQNVSEMEVIQESVKIVSNLRTEFVEGLGKRKEGTAIILNIDRVFLSDEFTSLHEAKAAGF